MTQSHLVDWLEQSFVDHRLDGVEKTDLRQRVDDLSPEMKRFIRNRAFDLVRDLINQGDERVRALGWLEQVIKTLDASEAPESRHEVCFSPGHACRGAILDCLHQARTSADICVFTVADDRITDAILKAFQRGIAVRLISDNDKMLDDGSDIQYLQQQGIPVRMDASPYHMHHKFALFDGQLLLNGSFNWTRSASENNFENLLLTTEPMLVNAFVREFEGLWERFA